MGSCFEERVATWAVALPNGGTFVADVPGVDQTPGFAEKWAVFQTARAASEAGCRVHLLVDNMTCVRACHHLASASSLPAGAAKALWHGVDEAIRAGPGFRVDWVPAHGKHPQWAPAQRGERASVWRSLNDAADRAASRRLKVKWDEFEDVRMALINAEKWEAAALDLQATALRRFREHVAPEQFGAVPRSSGGRAWPLPGRMGCGFGLCTG